MSPKDNMTTSNSLEDSFHFLSLPPQARVQIYDHVFSGAKIDLTVQNTSIAGSKKTRQDIVLTRANDFPNDILMTCKLIREEAMPMLASNVRLVVQPNNYRGRKPVQLDMPAPWIQCIPEIQYMSRFGSKPQLRLDLFEFRSLELVVLDTRIYNILSCKREQVKNMPNRLEWKFTQHIANQEILRYLPSSRINVMMKIWLLNRKMDQGLGWVVDFDVVNYRCVDIKQAMFFHCCETGRDEDLEYAEFEDPEGVFGIHAEFGKWEMHLME